MKTLFKPISMLTLLYGGNLYSDPIKSFDEITSKVMSGKEVRVSVDVEMCKGITNSSQTPNSLIENGFKTLQTIFTPVGTYHSIEEKTSERLITFTTDQNLLEYRPNNKAKHLVPVSTTTIVTLTSAYNVYLTYRIETSSTGKENIFEFTCDWDHGFSIFDKN